MTFLFAGLLIILSFIKKNSKFVLALLTTYTFIMTVYANNIPDLEVYRSNYYYGGKISEPLYVLGAGVFKSLGFDYTIYRGALCLGAIFLLASTFYEISPSPNIVFSMYLLYPLCYDAVQIRTFVSNAFVILSIRFVYRYLKDKKSINIVYFFISVLLGTGFHYTAIMFSILALCFFDMRKYQVIFWMVIPAVLGMTLLSFSHLMPMISNFISNTDRMERYIVGENKKSLIGLIGLFVPRIAYIVFFLFVSNIQKSPQYYNKRNMALLTIKNNYNESVEDNTKFVINVFTGVCYIFEFTILEITIAEDYERLIRVAITLCCILVSIILDRTKKDASNLMYIFLFVLQMSFLLGTLLSMHDVEGVFIPFMNSNLIL